MGSIHRYPPRQAVPGKCEVVDVKAELEEWREGIPSSGFYQPGTSFSRYEPSLMFAYDCYLQYHQVPLAGLLHTLEQRYEERFDHFERLDWHHMENLLREVWQRMGAPLGDVGQARAAGGRPLPLRQPYG
ncbi:hypothetical protein [Pseudoxanthomonas sp. z9]|uniref:hypothetical protein n=1 Tax=Pseudoxanthomonas sp. z9 TaxID=2584942 RepID=UPI001144EB38|nr:hypothetical protein [Pseudoxanthomonas sp. z9]